MTGTGTPSPAAIVALAVLAVLALAAVGYVARSRRRGSPSPISTDAAGAAAGPEDSSGLRAVPRVPPAGDAASPWPGGSLPPGLPPHIRPGFAAAGPAAGVPGPEPEAAAHASFGIGMTGIQVDEGALQVMWHGINDGNVPVAVQWGRPDVRVVGDRIEIRYVYEPQAEAPGLFQPPRTRSLGPEEIISRTAPVPLSEIGRDPSGMTIQVFVAFGAAAELAAAQSGLADYLGWQQITYTRPRAIPKLQKP